MVMSAISNSRRTVPDRLLRAHQPARVAVDQRQLLRGGQPVIGQRRVPLAHQFAQAGARTV